MTDCPDCGRSTEGVTRCRCGALVGTVARRPEPAPVRVNPERLAQIRAMLAGPGAAPSRQWARDLLSRNAAGEHLLPIQVELARAALAPQLAHRQREPGDDDDEPFAPLD